MPAAATEPTLDIDGLLGDQRTRIIVCCGAGGVGKTTIAASLGLRAAEAGRRVVVLTIDPARRLAQSLGLSELDNTPRPVSGFDTKAGGTLDAMMLDMKRTFDEVVEAHATPEKAQQILANPFYQAVSSSFAGTQEYMAMEKLGQLRARAASEDTWDLIVVDTPPSRSALDFLDAPKRLGSFLDGRFIRLLMAPAKAGGRAYLKVFSSGVTMATSVMSKVLGGQVLQDVQTFVAALDTMFGGFRERADKTVCPAEEPGDGLRGGRGARARCAARGVVLHRPARPGGNASRRGRRQPDPRGRRHHAEQVACAGGSRAAGGVEGRVRRPVPRRPGSPRGCCACTRLAGRDG